MVTMQSSLLGWGTVQSCLFRCTNAEFSVRMGKRFSLACFDITMQSPMFGWATVLHFFFDIIMQSSLLGRGTVPSCLFRYNNAEFYVDMGTDSVLSFLMQQCRVRCQNGERFSLVLFDVTKQSSLFGLGTVQSCLFRYDNAAFAVGMGNGSSCLFRYNNAEFPFGMGHGSVLSFRYVRV